MSGFIDVSHMSNEDVRRMGHADDDYEPTYRNPYSYRKPSVPKPKMSYTADNVWAAAWQAFVINGKQYIKAIMPGEANHKTNRMIAEELLKDQSQLTDESREQGEVMRRYFKGLTFNVIEGKQLSPFMQSAFDVSNKDEIFNNFDLAVIISLPATYVKATERDDVDRRITWARGGFVGNIGDKTKQQVEVLKRVWSKKYNTWFYNVINDQDQVMFFSYMKNELTVGGKIAIEATVKNHFDNTTQLNRVKVIV
jgi:hypothetical protein